MIWKSFLRLLSAILVIVWIVGYENFGINEIIEVWKFVQPGGRLHPVSFLEHKGHLVIESVLLIAIVYLVWLPRSRPKEQQHKLTEQEISELITDWNPDPLVPDTFQEVNEKKVVEGKIDKLVLVNGKKILNLQSTDFLGLLSDPEIEQACKECIQKYGVGSCGPRAFYGTVDVHLEFEKDIADFMGLEESILYPADIATVPSIVPAFANAKDILVVDECVYFPIQNACLLSRAQVLTFKHNDLEDLERVLIGVDQKHKEQKKPLNRRFIIVEGIYHDCGDVAPIDGIYHLKRKYKYRLIVDESLSFGVLGQTGRGACEHFGLAPGQVEIITASLSNALVSVGGFCVGDHEIVGHQRINGRGYIFSASLPPYLAVAADKALTELKANPNRLQQLRENACFFREELTKIPKLKVLGNLNKADCFSPVIHLQPAKDVSLTSTENREKLIAMENWLWDKKGVAIIVPRLSKLEWKEPAATLRLVISIKHTKEDLLYVKDSLLEASRHCL